MSISLAIREMQIQTTVRYHYMLIRMAKIKKKIVKMPNAGKDAENLEHLHSASENVKWYRHSGKQFGSFLRKI